jgi:tetratricopeptide (TPR) repeat protein
MPLLLRTCAFRLASALFFLADVVLVATPIPGLAQALAKRIDNVPMYGQPDTERPDSLKEQDEKFIAEAVAGLGSREAASHAWWRQAEEFFARRNLDLAMRRYNQAWLLNPKSFRPYWGFARVALEQGRADEAIRHFERATELIDDAFEKPALLTDTAGAYTFLGNEAQRGEAAQANYNRARALLSQAIAADPNYGNAYKRLAFLLYYQKDYVGAWEQVKLARSREGTQLPLAFIEDLRRMLAEPQ